MATKKAVVLGAGMVGRAMAIDLAENFEVTSADISEENLRLLPPKKIKPLLTDLSDPAKVLNAIRDATIVVGAVPGFMGFETVKTVIKAGKNIVDISFFPEDPFELDALAKKHKVIAVVDCGVAPGMDNIILGFHNERMQVEQFVCLVGGLPVKRSLPFQYKAPFSPIDVLEEYVRPSRIVENGKQVVRPALSEPELLEFDGIGTLEAFNTDGLRSLVKTMKIPNMKERTLRYPGHIDLMRTLREMGFLGKEEISAGGKKIAPIRLAASLLFPAWHYEEGEEEFTVMRVIVEGKENGKHRKYVYDLFDRYDHKTKMLSMARTTGYTCTAVVNLVADKWFSQTGINPPEFVGKHEKCFHFIIQYLEKRGVVYKITRS